MPCTYYSTEDFLHMARAELNKATALLCEAVQLLRNGETMVGASPELTKWAADHDKRDREREERQRLDNERNAKNQADTRERMRLIAEMTPEQRRILGL